MVDLTADGQGVLLAGVRAAGNGALNEWNFKSYGNVVDGAAVVMELPVSALGASGPPVRAADAVWTHEWPRGGAYFTAKAARGLAPHLCAAPLGRCDQVAVLTYAEVQGEQATVTLFGARDSGRALVWERKLGAAHGEVRGRGARRRRWRHGGAGR